MTTLKKIKFFGYLDMCSSISQLLATSVSSTFFLYFHHKNVKRDVGDGGTMSFFIPAFNLLVGVLVVYANVGQIMTTRKLIRSAVNGLYDEDLVEARENWGYWNGASCIVALIWYPLFSITTFQQYHWPIAYIGVCFVVIGGTKVVLTCLFYKTLAEDEEDDEIPPMELNMMEPPIEMYQVRHQGWL